MWEKTIKLPFGMVYRCLYVGIISDDFGGGLLLGLPCYYILVIYSNMANHYINILYHNYPVVIFLFKHDKSSSNLSLSLVNHHYHHTFHRISKKNSIGGNLSHLSIGNLQKNQKNHYHHTFHRISKKITIAVKARNTSYKY